MPEKIIKLRSRMTLRARIYRADPQISEDNLERFRASLKENEPKKALKYIWDRNVSGLFLRNEQQLIPWELCFQA